MRASLIAGLIALGLLVGSSLAQAQHSAPMAAGHSPAPPAQHLAPAKASPPHAPVSHRNLAPTAAVAAHPGTAKAYPINVYGVAGSPIGTRFIGPVSPGGFINPLGGTGHHHDHGRSNGTNGIIFFGGGYGYDYGGDNSQIQNQTQEPAQDQVDDQQSGGQQPQYIFVQQVPDPGEQAQQNSPDETLQVQPAEPSIPLRDVGSFTLVTLAGNRLAAVAFTLADGRLVYITPDGGRRTIALRDLDAESTRSLNQELGTPITLPEAGDTTPTKTKTKPSREILN
jgi:hypothetical protein